jgi:polyisoprenoid-binding protein YceI
MKTLPLLAAALVLASSPLAAAEWTVDPAHSALTFSGTQTGSPFQGHFTRWTAQIEFDPDHPHEGHAMVTIDMASAVTGDKQRDEALPQSDWFDVKKYPQAVFKADLFQPKGGKAYEALGSLTIRDATHSTTLPFTLETSGNNAHAVGKLEIRRGDYGVGQGMWSGSPWVGQEVTIAVDLTASRKP